MDASKFVDVDFVVPMLYISVALMLALIFIPTLLHGLMRRRKFATLVTGYQTYAMRSSIRTELIVATLAGIFAVVCALIGGTGYTKAMDNLAVNIQTQYNPSSLELGYWNGSWATANITLDDGTSFEDVVVQLEGPGKPFIEKVWYHQLEQSNE